MDNQILSILDELPNNIQNLLDVNWLTKNGTEEIKVIGYFEIMKLNPQYGWRVGYYPSPNIRYGIAKEFSTLFLGQENKMSEVEVTNTNLYIALTTLRSLVKDFLNKPKS